MSLATKTALASALKELMQKKTLDKISVKDITDLCGLNRQTFYYHFHDTYELLNWLYINDTKEIIEKMYNQEEEFAKYNLLLEYLMDNKNLVINTFHSFSDEFITGILLNFIKPVILEIVTEHIGDSPAAGDADFIAELYSYSLIGLMYDWVKKDLDRSQLPLFEKYINLLNNHLSLIKNNH
ncbi:MAG: TetR/AcrR family transcriptional regulator C-terminal domain-containing protein [Clostridiales bacterium]|nr:TetR/AcrR family transcriptional regulator C-terminal domain-containing protein [Clostridiales bacterium]